MRLGVAVAIALLVAGCGPKSEQENGSLPSENSAASNADAAETNVARNEVNEAASATDVNASAPAGDLGTLPPADAKLRFVGLWATSEANCATAPWRFAADKLSVEGGPQCTFYNVARAAGGYDLAAQCPTKEPVHTDLIKLRFAESARAMLVESNAIKPTGLIYCGK